MNNAELNKYIKHYIECDKTHRAIMLTALWGTGKSFYIQNELVPFLSKEENGSYKCIVISLYGINSISEISKAIYIESIWDQVIDRTPDKLKSSVEKVKNSKSEITGLLQGGAKTVLKGITSFFSVDLSMDESNLQKLYQSVNLSNSFIIFEDLERSGLNVLDVLGYVNNLVEHDNAKILIVANEDEILTYELGEPDKNGNCKKELDDDSVKYLKTKEKVIGDTICYKCDFDKAIKAIINLFDNDILLRFRSTEYVKDIMDIMYLKKSYNLRTFLFACQKASDIINIIKKDDLSFNKTVYYSIIAFSMMIKNGEIPSWKGSDLVSYDFGIAKYPLYRFCYDYIRWQEFEKEDVEKALTAHKKLILFNKYGSDKDPDLTIIYCWYEHTEQEVREALLKVESRLDTPDDIPFYDYRKLAYHLISLHTILEYDYSECKRKMINNISGKSFDIDESLLFLLLSDFESEQEKRLYHEFIDELKQSLSSNSVEIFSYNPDELEDFYYKLAENTEKYTRNHRFISKFEMNKMIDMLFRCSPAQLQVFRQIMFFIYRHATKYDFMEDDVLFMQSLKDRVNEKITESSESMDKIALQQFRWIINNVEEFINNLSI